MAELSAALGFRDLMLHFATPGGGITQIEAYLGPESRDAGTICLGAEPFSLAAGPGAVVTLPIISLHGEAVEGRPSYQLQLEASKEGRPLLDAVLALTLGTWGAEDRSTLELRTALFEIGAHYLDHSDEIRVMAAGPCADEIRLRLDFRDDVISGCFEDNGPAFDPSSSSRSHLSPSQGSSGRALAKEMGWFCRLLDEYEHHHEATGNRVGFHKRVGR